MVYLVSTKRLHDSWGGLHSLLNRHSRACCLPSASWSGCKRLLAPNYWSHISWFHSRICCLFSQWTQREFCFQCCIWMSVVIFIPRFWNHCVNLPASLEKNVWGYFPLKHVMSERTKFNQAQLPILATAVGQTFRSQMSEIITGCQHCLQGGQALLCILKFPWIRKELFVHPGKKIHLLCYMPHPSEFSHVF